MAFRRKKFIVLGLILIFWASMMYRVILREYFPERITQVKGDYKSSLAELKEPKHVRMSIHYFMGTRIKIGYFDAYFTPELDGTFTIESHCRISLSIKKASAWKQVTSLFNISEEEGDQFDTSFETQSRIGPDYQLKYIRFKVQSKLISASGEGNVRGGKLYLDIQHKGQTMKHEIAMPPGTIVNESLGVPGKFPKLEIGKRIEMKWFDPITQTSRAVLSEVKGKMTYVWCGKPVPVYVVWTTSGAFKTTAWVDEQGEILQYQVYSFILIKEPSGDRFKKEEMDSSNQTPEKPEKGKR